MLTVSSWAQPGASSDEQLMLELRQGHRHALERLFERYRERVWRFFRRRVAESSAAEELTQDVFASLLEAAPRYQPTAAFRSYLFAIAFNVLQSYRRRTARTVAGPLDPDALIGSDQAPDDGIWVRRALAQLDPDEREILMLREYEELTYQEIADAQGLPLNTVRSRLFRARMALRSALLSAMEGQGRNQ